MTKRQIEKERERILTRMQEIDVNSNEYITLTNRLKELTEIQKTVTEASVKRKESRRGVLKVILAGAFGVGQIVLLANYEEAKVLVGKAWNYVSKPHF